MRTTLELDQALVSRAQAEAARAGLPVDRFIEQLIERGLADRPRPTADEGPLPPLPVFRGGTGLMPGIDPLSNASLYEAMYAEEDARITRIAHGEDPDGPA